MNAGIRAVNAATGLIVALASALAMAQAPTPTESPMRRARVAHFELLMSAEFAALEQSAQQARKANVRLGDGQPLLVAVYAAATSDLMPLTDELWKVRISRLEAWRARYPQSVAAKVSVASYNIGYGMFARGGGYANTVSADGSALMRKRVEEARVALEALDPASKDDAGWSAAMLEVAILQGWPRDRFVAVYEPAASKYPDYYPIHFSLAQYNLPRWHGSPGEFSAAVNHIVQRTQMKMGETMYTRVHWTLQSPTMFRDGVTEWPRMKAGFERIVADYSDPWTINSFGKFACNAGDWATLRELTAKIGDTPMLAAWDGEMRHYHSCREAGLRGAPLMK